MYKDYRVEKPVEIEIELKTYENTCGGCPTIYDFTDTEGASYYFRLRHGGARLVCEDTSEVLLSEHMSGFDGVCGWDDFVKWAREHGVLVN